MEPSDQHKIITLDKHPDEHLMPVWNLCNNVTYVQAKTVVAVVVYDKDSFC